MADGFDSPERRLGLRFRVRKTPQEKGRKGEIKMARDRDARPHPGSGSGRIKDDASNDTTRYEFKHVAKSHTLHGGYLLGLFKRALREGLEPEYVIYFEDHDITATITLRRGNHA